MSTSLTLLNTSYMALFYMDYLTYSLQLLLDTTISILSVRKYRLNICWRNEQKKEQHFSKSLGQ